MKTLAASMTAIIAGVFLLSGCAAGGDYNGSGEESLPPETITTDPRAGWVEVFISPGDYGRSTIYKRCDGPNLVYFNNPYSSDLSDTLSVIADSTECVQQ